MNTILKTILKNSFILISTLLLTIGFFVAFAWVIWPQSSPWDEGWKFMTWFNNMRWTACPNWQALIWFNSDFTKKCSSFTPAPNPISWSCNTATKWWCSSGVVSWINNTSSCWTTATWICSWQNGWSNSPQCSFYNPACTPAPAPTPTPPPPAPVKKTCTSWSYWAPGCYPDNWPITVNHWVYACIQDTMSPYKWKVCATCNDWNWEPSSVTISCTP